MDTIPDRPDDARSLIRGEFFQARFPQIYDLLEFFCGLPKTAVPNEDSIALFADLCNLVLERERAAFRVLGDQVVPITNKEEIEEIKASIEDSSIAHVRTHISAALRQYSDKENPDYRNSIKESISAVESAVFHLSGCGNGNVRGLGELVRELGLHPALAQAFTKLYGYTSDASGIRHALMDEKTVTQDDARYMLVSCSAFVNYLVKLRVRRIHD